MKVINMTAGSILIEEGGGVTRLAAGGLSEKMIKKNLKKDPEVIIEFGSFDGGGGVRYKKIYPSARVISIEAHPELYCKIKELEQPFGIEAYNYVVTDKDGPVKFNTSILNNDGRIAPTGSELLATKMNQNQRTFIKYNVEEIDVSGIRFDTFCSENEIESIDILHVDTQGTFMHVVRGLGDIRPKLILGEVNMHGRYHEADKNGEAINLMKKLGYSVVLARGVDAIFKFKGEV